MRAGAYCPSRERSGRRVERTPSTVTMMTKIVPTQTFWTTEESLWTTEAVGRRSPNAEWPKPPTTATLPCVLNKPSKGSTLERGALGHRQALVASPVGRRAFRTHRPLRWSPAAGLCCMHRVAVSIAAVRVGAAQARPVVEKVASCEPRYAAPTQLHARLPSQSRRACATAVFADACYDTFRPCSTST